MPRNRAHENRDEKREAIVAVARRLFAERGFDGTSVAAIATEAHITKNTIYWYFDDKDGLLVAVVSSAVREAQRGWNDGERADLVQRLERLVQTFDAIHPLTSALHARVGASEAVRAWHDRFHTTGERWLEHEITAHLEASAVAEHPAGLVDSTVQLWAMAIEGMVTHQLSPADRRAMCELLVAQLEAVAAAGLLRAASAQPA